MDIYKTLKSDHALIRKFIREISGLATRKPRTRQKLAEKFKVFVESHSKAEEEVFYQPLLQSKASERLALEGNVEHQVVADLLSKLQATDPRDAKWLAYFKVIQENLEHHIEEEEKETFKKARKVIPTRTGEKLGEEMDTKRNSLLHRRGFAISEYRPQKT